MITSTLAILVIFQFIGIVRLMHAHTQELKQLKSNNYHLQRSREYLKAFLETNDMDYLDYSNEELKKVRF